MNLSLLNGIIGPHRPGGRRDVRRPVGRRKPSFEPLDGRQLLSAASAATAVLPAPSAATVSSAAAILNNLDPTTFAGFQAALARAEAHSRVTAAQAGRLAQDEAALDQAIDSAGLDANTTATDLNQVQSDVANAFIEDTSPAAVWAQKKQKLEQDVPEMVGSSRLIGRTIAQMKIVARAAGVTPKYNTAINNDWSVLANDLGPTPGVDLGPTGAKRDPLDVYYDAQVNDFVKG